MSITDTSLLEAVLRRDRTVVVAVLVAVIAVSWIWIGLGAVVQARSEPIRNPVTDQEGRMILVLPKGWVFHEAENASGFAKGLGAIKFDLHRRHSSLAHIAWNQNGLLHSYDEYKQKFGRP